MKTISIIFQSSYALLTICLGAVGYIYVVHGLGGDSVMGVLALAVIAVFAAMLYKLGGYGLIAVLQSAFLAVLLMD